ncbi:MAG: hypothetical protein LBM00_08440 [Deltaproteobacteria bacterium]|jgi:hypothetical protein|nr:hypothetical protein [Deltaproteobacteria bacterium]
MQADSAGPAESIRQDAVPGRALFEKIFHYQKLTQRANRVNFFTGLNRSLPQRMEDFGFARGKAPIKFLKNPLPFLFFLIITKSVILIYFNNNTQYTGGIRDGRFCTEGLRFSNILSQGSIKLELKRHPSADT